MATFAVQSKSSSRWIRAGLWALPVSWLVTAWSTLDPQPDQAKDPEAWARFVSSDAYQFSHLFGSTAGTILALFGLFAVGCSMANSRTGSLAMASMVTAVAGTALLLVPAVISTFATPAIGKAYLGGNQDVMQLEFPASMTGAFMLGLLLAFVGTVLLGIAVWRSHVLPRWAGALWAAGAVVFYVLGVVLGQVTAGSSLPSQAAGAVLMAGAGGWIAWSGSRQATTAPDRIG
ncbi:hypothetical protein NFC73_03565 [Pseudarthrobacter sp. RMG13]|uniref:DUF4386 family protein n=1 Tax=Pseudarthrobacter humi TaxID=2952523 RepID=A0ABT1LL62_9MICC|nr:hypothetical protein [Pseudarthrobacter humi]MCP8998819.1 hypothetical protein [Pseudarthrobacter humi]